MAREYKVRNVRGNDLQSALNEEAKAGWELVNSFKDLGTSIPFYKLILKRES